jgi:hypothetical protein
MNKRDPETHLPLLVCEVERLPRRHRFVSRRNVANLGATGRSHLMFRCESCGSLRVYGCEDGARESVH